LCSIALLPTAPPTTHNTCARLTTLAHLLFSTMHSRTCVWLHSGRENDDVDDNAGGHHPHVAPRPHTHQDTHISGKPSVVRVYKERPDHSDVGGEAGIGGEGVGGVRGGGGGGGGGGGPGRVHSGDRVGMHANIEFNPRDLLRDQDVDYLASESTQ
jgi:uncharacterized membrane protein YgcG